MENQTKRSFFRFLCGAGVSAGVAAVSAPAAEANKSRYHPGDAEKIIEYQQKALLETSKAYGELLGKLSCGGLLTGGTYRSGELSLRSCGNFLYPSDIVRIFGEPADGGDFHAKVYGWRKDEHPNRSGIYTWHPVFKESTELSEK